MNIGGTAYQVDQLDYEYIGNRLKKVDDNIANTNYEYGFTDNGIFLDAEYQYDNNGNMILNRNKNISQIDYNHLNLPVYIGVNQTQSNKINYIYSVDGIKLRKSITSNGVPQTKTDYSGSFVYENDQLLYIFTSEGRIVPNINGGFSYEYALKDHLGNTRIMFTDKGEVIQDQSYYPFGMSMGDALTTNNSENSPENHYLYNGKELQDDFDLDWYDYGARFYDPAISRWNVIDNKAEKYNSITPYAYAANNPILYIDPDGNEIKIKRISEQGKKDRLQISVTAKVYNASSKNISSTDLNNYAGLIGNQIKNSFGGDYKNVSVEVSTDIQVVDDLSKTKGSDHLFMISDASDSNLQNSDGTVNAGASNIGGQVASINADIVGDDSQLERTGAHEFGHMAGLAHPDDESDQSVKDAASNDKDNLMHQSKTTSGTNIVEEQINKIEDENK
jgi:RHS repeat-associated protein